MGRTHLPWDTFTKNFHWDYWASFGVTSGLIIAFLSLWVARFGRFANNDFHIKSILKLCFSHRSGSAKATLTNLLCNLSHMCQALCTLDTVSTTDDHLAQMWSYRLILFSAAFFGTLNFYFYNAVLISQLTVTDEQPQVDRFSVHLHIKPS